MTVVLVGRSRMYLGLSTDTKPTPTAGCTFRETDTGLTWVYSGSAWALLPAEAP